MFATGYDSCNKILQFVIYNWNYAIHETLQFQFPITSYK